MFRKFFRSLYWKISALFLILLVLIGMVYTYVTLFTAEMYVQEATQKVSTSLGQHIVQQIHPSDSSRIDETTLKRVFENAISLNPGIEIYLLDPNGNILASSIPDEKIKYKHVSVEHIKKFIADEGKNFILGEDPRGQVKEKVFSAAPVMINGNLSGYLYIILRGAEYDSMNRMLLDSYILRLGTRSLIVTLVAASIVALVILSLLLKKLRRMQHAVTAFEKGNLSSRITVTSNDEIAQLAQAFNSMADTIVQNLENIKHTDDLRRELIANISHDLKTPLTSIQGYIETLILKADNLPAEERKEYLEIILSGTERLIILVEQILEFSKLEAKQTLPSMEPFSIAELVQDVVQKFQPQAEKQKIRLRAVIPKDLLLVYADIAMIERVLQNLIDNAMRHTPEIGVVTVEIVRNNNSVVVNISDTGYGIPQEDLPHIFDRFYRAEKSRSRNSGGTGLGLAITQKILEAHNSDITVQSAVSAGTTFSFHLPIYNQA